MSDAIGDRMKLYESMECGRRMMPLLPVLARVDGRAFHSFTRGMNRPFDERMQAAMIETAKALAMETNACMAYTQSDEITLAWHSTDHKSQLWFDGRICKMVSQLGAQATLAFYRTVTETMPEYAASAATDCSTDITFDAIKQAMDKCRELRQTDVPDVYVMTSEAYRLLREELGNTHPQSVVIPPEARFSPLSAISFFGIPIEHYATLREVHERCLKLRDEGKRVALVCQ